MLTLRGLNYQDFKLSKFLVNSVKSQCVFCQIMSSQEQVLQLGNDGSNKSVQTVHVRVIKCQLSVNPEKGWLTVAVFPRRGL